MANTTFAKNGNSQNGPDITDADRIRSTPNVWEKNAHSGASMTPEKRKRS